MSNENCSSAQTYCKSCQSVKEYDEIKFKFSPENEPKRLRKVNDKWKSEVIEGLKKINNFNKAGVKKPALTDINSLQKIVQKKRCNINDFNEIIDVLEAQDTYKVKEKERLLGSYFSILEDLINNFQLSSDSCQTCNSGCNTTCQASSQGGGGDCGEGCRGGNCLASGICSCMACQSCYYQSCNESGCNQCSSCLVSSEGSNCPVTI